MAVSSWRILLFSGSGTYHKMLEICRKTPVFCKWQDLLQGHTEGLDKPVHKRQFCRKSHNQLRPHCPQRATSNLASSSWGKTSRIKLPQDLKVLLVPQVWKIHSGNRHLLFSCTCRSWPRDKKGGCDPGHQEHFHMFLHPLPIFQQSFDGLSTSPCRSCHFWATWMIQLPNN